MDAVKAVKALPANPQNYPAPVWRLFNETPLVGDFPPDVPDVWVAEVRTPAARAVLRLALRCEGSKIADARFRAYGCPVCIAVGAWIAQWSVGRTLSELAALQAVDLQLALEIPEDRIHCALLGEDVLKTLLARLKETSRHEHPTH